MTHLNEITQIYLEEVASKPDFLDLDKDGNKKEPMKSAAKQVEAPKERLKTDRNMFNISKDEQKAAKERLLAKARAKRAKMSEGLDPVGQEDADVDNDGKKNTKSDKYLLKRRKAIAKAIKEAKHATAKQMHSPHEVPSGNLKGLVKKAVKRIDTDVDGDTDNNDKAKGELGEFIPGVGNKRLYSSTKTTTAKESFSNWRNDLREVVGEGEEEEVQIKEKKVKNNIKINPNISEEFTIIEMVEVSEDTEIDEGIGMTMANAIGSPPVLSKRMKLKQALINREISKETAKNKKRKFSGKAATTNEETEIDEKFSMAADPSKPESPRSTRKAENKKGMSLRSRAIKAVGTQTRQDKETGVREEVELVDEKLNMKKEKMGDVIKDFYKSDAPQFKGKSKEKRREMAIAAKLTAERGGQKLGESEMAMTQQELSLQKKKTRIDQMIAKKRQQALQKQKPQNVQKEERKPEVEAQGKKVSGYEKAGKYQGIVSKFRKEYPGSRQQPKQKGRKPTEGELTQARIQKHNQRVAKHGFTSKEKKESKAREKYDSPRD